MRRARSCPPITSCANAATCQQLRSHMVAPYRSSTSRGLFARETQTVIRSLARFSASVRNTSRWSGSPSSTPVRHVPHTPCSHDVSTSHAVLCQHLDDRPTLGDLELAAVARELDDEALLRPRERGRVRGEVLEMHGVRRPRGGGGRLDQVHERTRAAQIEMPVRRAGSTASCADRRAPARARGRSGTSTRPRYSGVDRSSWNAVCAIDREK